MQEPSVLPSAPFSVTSISERTPYPVWMPQVNLPCHCKCMTVQTPNNGELLPPPDHNSMYRYAVYKSSLGPITHKTAHDEVVVSINMPTRNCKTELKEFNCFKIVWALGVIFIIIVFLLLLYYLIFQPLVIQLTMREALVLRYHSKDYRY